jgi:hypothetical protein
MNKRERLISEELSELVFNGGLSNEFISYLNTIAIRSRGQEVSRDMHINNIPNEILCIIFEYVGIWRPLVKFTCYRWMLILHKHKYNRKMILEYDSPNVLSWVCKYISYGKLRTISPLDIMQIGMQNTTNWFIKNVHWSSKWARYELRCMLFKKAVERDCLLVAQCLYDCTKERDYRFLIKIKKSHLVTAYKSGNYDMFVWLDEISSGIFRDTKILKGMSVYPNKLCAYARYHNIM